MYEWNPSKFLRVPVNFEVLEYLNIGKVERMVAFVHVLINLRIFISMSYASLVFFHSTSDNFIRFTNINSLSIFRFYLVNFFINFCRIFFRFFNWQIDFLQRILWAIMTPYMLFQNPSHSLWCKELICKWYFVSIIWDCLRAVVSLLSAIPSYWAKSTFCFDYLQNNLGK